MLNWEGPDCARDLADETSVDELTVVPPLPGLSVSGLAVEPWWEDRPLDVWLARRLYDYRHLTEQRGDGTRTWIVSGTEVGRGPDSEPLVNRCRLVAAVDVSVIDQAIERIKAAHGRVKKSSGRTTSATNNKEPNPMGVPPRNGPTAGQPAERLARTPPTKR